MDVSCRFRGLRVLTRTQVGIGTSTLSKSLHPTKNHNGQYSAIFSFQYDFVQTFVSDFLADVCMGAPFEEGSKAVGVSIPNRCPYMTSRFYCAGDEATSERKFPSPLQPMSAYCASCVFSFMILSSTSSYGARHWHLVATRRRCRCGASQVQVRLKICSHVTQTFGAQVCRLDLGNRRHQA